MMYENGCRAFRVLYCAIQSLEGAISAMSRHWLGKKV
jgi:hypothetical protein